ncbi:unnamed protein product [Oikopleura dioica]|uniref:Uncharacterized protein n=1 Tax=Oikopleura dioica TaxID=34765 RepID=E4XLK2_OIKDI|nr:unnamed protein product [Oikopleura dioica]
MLFKIKKTCSGALDGSNGPYGPGGPGGPPGQYNLATTFVDQIKAQSTVLYLEFAMATLYIMLRLLELLNLITTLLLTTRKHLAQTSSIQLMTESHSNFSRSLPNKILISLFSEIRLETTSVDSHVRVFWMELEYQSIAHVFLFRSTSSLIT